MRGRGIAEEILPEDLFVRAQPFVSRFVRTSGTLVGVMDAVATPAFLISPFLRIVRSNCISIGSAVLPEDFWPTATWCVTVISMGDIDEVWGCRPLSSYVFMRTLKTCSFGLCFIPTSHRLTVRSPSSHSRVLDVQR